MRRNDKEVQDRGQMEAIIARATVLRVAMFDEPYPYLVPVNFGYREGVFFFHSAPAGRKIDLLRRNNRVGFELEVTSGVLQADTPCKWSTTFASVIGTGMAYFVEDPDEKWKGMETIFLHYASDPFEIPVSALAQVAVIRIEIAGMSGKVSPRPQRT